MLDKNKWQLFVFVYSVVWLVIFIFIMMFQPFRRIFEDPALGRVFYFTLASGGMGGTVGILYGLYYHVVIARDFKPHFTVFYMLQPIGGMIAGFLVYVISSLIFAMLKIGIVSNAIIMEFIILLSWFAGFRQNRVGWATKIAELFHNEDSDNDEPPATQ